MAPRTRCPQQKAPPFRARLKVNGAKFLAHEPAAQCGETEEGNAKQGEGRAVIGDVSGDRALEIIGSIIVTHDLIYMSWACLEKVDTNLGDFDVL